MGEGSLEDDECFLAVKKTLTYILNTGTNLAEDTQDNPHSMQEPR